MLITTSRFEGIVVVYGKDDLGIATKGPRIFFTNSSNLSGILGLQNGEDLFVTKKVSPKPAGIGD